MWSDDDICRRNARKQGKQPGSEGKTLRLVDDPDAVIDHVPGACAGCGSDLTAAAPAGWGRRQVHDIPPVSVTVTEHRLHRRQCPCGRATTAPAPDGVDGTAVYGPGLRAFAVYLLVYQHIPVARTAELIADLTGAKVSTGWVCSTLTRAANVLVGVEAMTTTLITLATIGHFDETSLNVNGGKWWLHVACTETLTAYHLHRSRGRVAVDEFSVLPAFTGTAVHDALSVYDGENYRAARHALCAAHVCRELTAAAETHPDHPLRRRPATGAAESIRAGRRRGRPGSDSPGGEPGRTQGTTQRPSAAGSTPTHPRFGSVTSQAHPGCRYDPRLHG